MSRPSLPRPRRRARSLALAAAVAVAAFAPIVDTAHADGSSHSGDGSEVVVANRGSGDISVIDTGSLDVTTIDLPGDAEPMYVNHDPRADRVFIGDRANDTIIVLDDDSYEVVGSVAVGDGVFHQWLDPRRRQLWVVGDTSQTVSVVDTRRLSVMTTIDVPADLVARGGKPHDVFVKGRHAFVTILGLDDGTGAVVQYSTRTFAETGRISTGDDPHVFVAGSRLYVASQDGAEVTRHSAGSLRQLGSIDVPSAHGIFVTDRREVLVTNIAGGGSDAVYELDRRLRHVVDTVDTDAPTPHNVTVDDNRQVFVTHSGATADQVSVIDLDRNGFGGTQLITVGTNPFGLAFVR